MTKSSVIVPVLGCLAAAVSITEGLAYAVDSRSAPATASAAPNSAQSNKADSTAPQAGTADGTTRGSQVAAADKTNVKPLKGKKILLDPGHGGTDPGAFRQGVVEKQITLAVGLDLGEKLRDMGADVTLTRQTDVPVPLPVRLADSNTSCPDIFLSIHVNAVSRPAIRGIETYYYGSRSAPLAGLVLNKLSTDLREPAKWSHNRDLFVLDGNRVPATLAEIGYLTNPQTRDLLNRPAYQEKVANALAESVASYLNSPGASLGCDRS